MRHISLLRVPVLAACLMLLCSSLAWAQACTDYTREASKQVKGVEQAYEAFKAKAEQLRKQIRECPQDDAGCKQKIEQLKKELSELFAQLERQAANVEAAFTAMRSAMPEKVASHRVKATSRMLDKKQEEVAAMLAEARKIMASLQA